MSHVRQHPSFAGGGKDCPLPKIGFHSVWWRRTSSLRSAASLDCKAKSHDRIRIRSVFWGQCFDKVILSSAEDGTVGGCAIVLFSMRNPSGFRGAQVFKRRQSFAMCNGDIERIVEVLVECRGSGSCFSRANLKNCGARVSRALQLSFQSVEHGVPLVERVVVIRFIRVSLVPCFK